MNSEQCKKAATCSHNYLWECTHKDNRGKECTGPCRLFDNGKVLCPLCFNPVEQGRCVNINCDNHGRQG
jgi:hypothetical protein